MKVKLTQAEKFQQAVDFFGTQKEFAKKLGVSQQFISKLAVGKSPVPLIIAMRIEKLTGGKIKADALITEEIKCYLKNI